MESAILVFGVFFILAFLRVPLAVSFGISGIIGILISRTCDTALLALGASPWQWATAEGFITIPLFVLMGEFIYRSEIAEEMFEAAQKWVGHLPGGLCIGTIIACALFAGCTGSSLAAAATIGAIAYPSLKKCGYADFFATGTIASGGTLGIMIPPSIPMIIYGMLTNIAIGDLFVAGIIPGIILAGFMVITVLIVAILKKNIAPRGPHFSLREKLISLRGIFLVLGLFIFIIGGLYFGIFSPTEAGSVGSFLAFLLCLMNRKLTFKKFFDALKSTAELSCMILTLIVGAMVFMVYIGTSGLGKLVGDFFMGLPFSRVGIMLVIIGLYILVGMFLDVMSGTIILIPILTPVVKGLGFDLIWFAVLVILLNEVGLLTPPIGMNVFVLNAVTKVEAGIIFKGIFLFLPAFFAYVLLMFLFPGIPLYLLKIR